MFACVGEAIGYLSVCAVSVLLVNYTVRFSKVMSTLQRFTFIRTIDSVFSMFQKVLRYCNVKTISASVLLVTNKLITYKYCLNISHFSNFFSIETP